MDSFAAGLHGVIEEKPTLPMHLDDLGPVGDIDFFLQVDIYNGKSRPIALGDLAGVFKGKDGTAIKRPVFQQQISYNAEERRLPEQLPVVNIPAHTVMNLALQVNLGHDRIANERDMIERCTYAVFQEWLANGRLQRWKVQFSDTLGPYPDRFGR